MTLQYSVIRFSPRAGRGESLNVGVVVVDPVKGRGRVALTDNRPRLHAIGDRELVASTLTYLDDWKERIEAAGSADSEVTLSAEWLSERFRDGNNLLQFSPPAPVLVTSVSEALALLSQEFLPPDSKQRAHPEITRRRAVSAIKNAYSSEGLQKGVHFVERPMIRSKNYGEVMDFAVANGKAVQIAQSWNFRQRNVGALAEAVKAWAWTIQDIRAHGGSGRWGSRFFGVPKDVDVEAVYIEPDDSAGEAAMDEARHAFREVAAKVSPMNETGKLARRAVRALAGVA